MSAATIASLRAAAEAQKASAERALRTLDEMEARGDTDDDASEELASLASWWRKSWAGWWSRGAGRRTGTSRARWSASG